MSFSSASMAADEPPADRGEPHQPSIQSLLDGLAQEIGDILPSSTKSARVRSGRVT